MGYGTWRSLVAHQYGVLGVGGSNPLVPTTKYTLIMANALTIFRLILIPVFIILIFYPSPVLRYYALGVFILASLTDAVDGFVARKMKSVSEFGKHVDPFADRLLIISALVCLIIKNETKIWIAVLIIARDLLILIGFLSVKKKFGISIPVSVYGKITTVVVLIAIAVAIFGLKPYSDYLLYFAGILSVISALYYVIRAKRMLLTREIVKKEAA